MRAKYPHTEGKIDRNGVNLHYEIYGSGQHTILFIPTWAVVHSRAYKSQIPYFSEHFRCVTWDPRGNGKSDRPIDPQSHRLTDHVEDALAVMDVTDTLAAILYGLSYSTVVEAALATYFPDRVQALIMVGTNSPMCPTYEYENWETWDQGTSSIDGWGKFTRNYWKISFPDFAEFFANKVYTEKHSTKHIEDTVRWATETNGEVLAGTMDAEDDSKYELDESAYRRINCPVLIVYGSKDKVTPPAVSQTIAELTNAEILVYEEAGHNPAGRFPAHFNTRMRNFLAKHLGSWKPEKVAHTRDNKRVLFLSSPIGLGHARRDLAISREMRKLHPSLEVEWLAQDPVTRLLAASDETIHPASEKLASESRHIESEAGEHDLHAFQAIRSMDEILLANFMIFQELLEQTHYDLVIADEAWDVDHYWHEHPKLKRSAIAWLTDFVGWLPMPEGGDYEEYLTTDYNAEMIGHVEKYPHVRDHTIFIGNPEDIVPLGFGNNLPLMRDWIPQHYEFSGYVLGQHPRSFGARDELRARFGYADGEKICIVTVGGSGVGGRLINRILESYPIARARIPELRMIVVTGPRLDPAQFELPVGVEIHPFVPDLDQRLAACDLALVQGGLTTTMELTAAGIPFLYFPLHNHFEQNFHVSHRLDQYRAGRKMIYRESNPDCIAAAMVEDIERTHNFRPVEEDGASRVANKLVELL